jgi:hypothetical protein
VSEPLPPSPPPAPPGSPWNPPATATTPARSGPGCSKPLLLGCGALIVLLGLGAILFFVNMPSIVQWWFGKLEVTLEPRLPDDASSAERARFHAAFAAARRAFSAGTVDASRLQPFQGKLLEVGGSDKKMTHEQLRDLTVALERLAGKVPAGSPAPAPARLAPSAPKAPA